MHIHCVGVTEECYGGIINASCNCDCYDELFTGIHCTGISSGILQDSYIANLYNLHN